MFKKLSIRDKFIISIFLGVIIPFFFGGLFIKNSTEEWLYKDTIENSITLLTQVSEYVDDAIIKNIESQVSMMAADERVIDGGISLRDYIEYNEDHVMSVPTDDELRLERYFKTIKDNNDAINFIFYGTNDGNYMEYPSFNPKSAYDPRVRTWYITTEGQEQTVLSEPYRTLITNELVVSVTKNVIKKGKKIGVIGVSLNLKQLMASINDLKYGDTGYIKVLNPSNVFMIAPVHQDWLMQSLEDLDIPALKNYEAFDGSSYEGKIDQKDRIISVYISPYSHWRYLGIIDKGEILAQSGSMTNLLLLVYLITFALIIIIILVLSQRITKPILKISKVINEMSTFRFDNIEDNNLERYNHQEDEIGEITKALRQMQINYMELKSNMSYMDQEIQNIDVNEVSNYHLVLSDDNPFDSISESVNGLLDKVHVSMEMIKSSNEEILEKNEQLSAIEEELISQLDEINNQKEYISFLANHDPLTNLPNRRQFNEKLEDVIRNNGVGAVLLLDLDNFKGINDTLGHVFGDKVLQHVSKTIAEHNSEKVFVSRFGGDEFLLLYETDEDESGIEAFAQVISHLFDERFVIDDIVINIEFSMGISLFPKDSKDINKLIMNADLALYTIKNNGKNSYALFNTKMAEHIKTKSDIQSVLSNAIENDGFSLVYQPQVNLVDGHIIGYEALVRLKGHPISPGEFIPVAEDNGMVIKIGRIVTQKVIEQMGTWKKQGFKIKPVAINFSAVQLHDHEYKRFLLELLEANEIDPSFIVIEITENIFLDNKEGTIIFLNDLRSYGIKIAIDDFGTGYSSLSYLTFLPIDTVKLDRTLSVKFLELDNISVMDSLISLAHSLNLKVIAEGIEDLEQVKRLMVGKCDAIQGYYFSKPLEVEDVEANFGKVYRL